ncbi:hypothetical protein ISS86_02870, partial [Candidatus Microgenomates bacterium]|nr:hypothetical protein [Candidatus Microgenomates bacterium]
MLKFKTIFFIFCLLIFLFQAGAVLALEIKYPSVPGAETPNQIQKKLDTGLINQKDALPLYINYFLRFFFVLSISIAVAVIIYGGVLYLISGAKPAVLITARAWMSRGLLGLTILICSYLVLGLINPQLLTFKIDREVSPIISFAPAEHPDDSIVALQIPAGTIIDEAISYMMAETSTEWGDVYAAEVPFLEIMDMLDNVTSTNQVLKVLFAECQCGKSKYHPEWDGFIGKCVAGDEGQATTSPEWWKLGSNVCSLVCEICGGENEPEDCDLREPDPDNPEQGLIKQARDDLIELFAKLQVQKVKLSSDQISLIEHVLKLNQTNFLLHKLLGTTFQNDFEALKKEIEAEGYPVSFEKPENLPEPGMIRMSPLRQDPFTFFAVTYDPFGIFGSIARLNKETEEESYRLSLFSILSQLSLEDIEDMINQCFVSAFGAGSFMLDNEQFLETVNEALQNSVSDYLGTLTLGAAFDIIDNFCEKLGDEIDNAVEDDANESIQECINNCAGNQECIDKCQDTIPPHFLSKALNDLLVLDTKEHLPDEIKARLDEKLRHFIFDEELNHVLDDDMINLLDGVLQGALKKSIKDQIPFLRENLEKKMLN